MSRLAANRCRSEEKPADVSSASPSRTRSRSADRTSSTEVWAVAETRVRTKSRRTSAISSPSAEKLPGSGGTTTVRMPSSSATAVACNGPAPPNGSRAKSRGSMPRITDTSLIAPASETAAMRKCLQPSAGPTPPAGQSRDGAGPRAVERSLRRAAVDAQASQHYVASEMVGSMPPRPKHAGPGIAPADRGPTVR